MSRAIIKIEIKKLDGDYNYFKLNIKDMSFSEICKMLKTSICEIMKNRAW